MTTADAMTAGDPKSAGQAVLQDTCERSSHPILGNWRFWLALATVAVIAAAALNWSWLIAVGLAPLLLTFLPCAVMCALGLCLMKKAGADRKSSPQQTTDGSDHLQPYRHEP